MATNRVKLKTPKGDSVIETYKDQVEYFLKMGYTKVNDVDIKKPINNNMKKNKDTK